MSALAFISNAASSRRYLLVGCLIVFSFFLLSTHVYQIHNETLLFTPYHGALAARALALSSRATEC
jgi:alpha 1,6-mannosyltransferase